MACGLRSAQQWTRYLAEAAAASTVIETTTTTAGHDQDSAAISPAAETWSANQIHAVQRAHSDSAATTASG